MTEPRIVSPKEAQVWVTLTEFLLARIDEDEAEAYELSRHIGRWQRESELNGADGTQGSIVVSLIAGSPSEPARVLAECEAKRRVVEMAEGYDFYLTGPILAALALPYVDHQDFDPAWRV